MLTMFNALSVVKFAVSGVVGIGTGKIVGKIIKDHVTTDTLLDKISITAATWVISGVATTATKKYTNETIDDVSRAVNQVVDKFKMDSKLGRVNRGESTLEKEGLDPDLFQRDENMKWKPIKVASDN